MRRLDAMFVVVLGGGLAVGMAAGLLGPEERKVPKTTEPMIYDFQVAHFSRKPCPQCDASSIRFDEAMNRCQVCGCEFMSAD